MHRIDEHHHSEITPIIDNIAHQDLYDEFVSYVSESRNIFCEATSLFYANGKWFTPEGEDECLWEETDVLFVPSREEFYQQLDKDGEYSFVVDEVKYSHNTCQTILRFTKMGEEDILVRSLE